jgi:hypothetical protein
MFLTDRHGGLLVNFIILYCFSGIAFENRNKKSS